MRKHLFSPLAIFSFLQFTLGTALSPPSLAREWAIQKARGTIRVVDLFQPTPSVMFNYAEGLVTLDKDNNWAPCLAKDWRWVEGRTIEFKLRRGLTFHNGEPFNAEAVRLNWEGYKRIENPRVITFSNLSDKTLFEKLVIIQ